MNLMVGAFLTSVHVSRPYVLSDLVRQSAWVNYVNAIKLKLLEIFDKSYR